MEHPTSQYVPVGGWEVRPRVVFGAAALGNVPHVIPEQRKLEICGVWFRHVGRPVFIDAAYKHGGGLALKVLGRLLRRLDVASDEVVINVTLDWDQSPDVILQQWKKSCRLLGDAYQPRLAAFAIADEYLATAQSAADHEAWLQSVVRNYQALAELKAAEIVAGVGVVARDWRIANELVDVVPADWVTLSGCFTLMRRSPDVLGFMAGLAERQLPVILSGVFNGGFLVGGNCLDGRLVKADDPADRSLFAWRKAFVALCHAHGVTPAHACIQFALSGPGVVAVEINSSYPDRVAENVESVAQKITASFWASMKEEGLLCAGYPGLEA